MEMIFFTLNITLLVQTIIGIMLNITLDIKDF